MFKPRQFQDTRSGFTSPRIRIVCLARVPRGLLRWSSIRTLRHRRTTPMRFIRPHSFNHLHLVRTIRHRRSVPNGFGLELATYWFDECVYVRLLYINKEVGSSGVDSFLFKDFPPIIDLGDVTVVVFSPNIFLEVVDVDPVVAERDRASVDENGMKTIGERTKVGELACDARIEMRDLRLNIWKTLVWRQGW